MFINFEPYTDSDSPYAEGSLKWDNGDIIANDVMREDALEIIKGYNAMEQLVQDVEGVSNAN